MTTINEARRDAVASGAVTVVGASRSQEFKSQLRAQTVEKDGKSFVHLNGYASVVNTPYTMWDMFGEYEEVVAGAAFDVTLARQPDVAFLLNHTGMTMARTTAGTLILAADEVGLLTDAYLNPLRSDVQDLRLAIEDESITEMSFAFRIVSGRWADDFMTYIITEVDIDRGDVSAVNYGANPNTSISARAKQAMDAIDHLSGVPLQIAAERAAARLAEAGQPAPAVTAPVEPTRSTMNAETARRVLELQESK